MSHWLAQSPVCCDSRAELLTGKMFHNLRLGETFGTMSNYLDPPTLVVPHTGWITALLVLLIGVSIFLLVPLLAYFFVNSPYCNKLEEKLMVLSCRWNRSTTLLSEPLLLSNHLQELNDENDATTRGGAACLRRNQKLTLLFIGVLSVLIIIAISIIVVLNKQQSGKAGQGCMNIDVADNIAHPFYQRDFFAGYFKELGYTVGYFGKLLNSELPTTFRPMGVDEMFINDGGTYLDPKFTIGNDQSTVHEVLFNNCTVTTGMPCYSTSLIGNASLAWIQRHTAASSVVAEDDNKVDKRPFFAFIALKAPHIEDNESVTFAKAIPAPWYSNTTINETKAIRTPNYNCSTDNHHWLIRNQLPMTDREANEADTLHVSRLKALMSVDDLVDDLFQLLDDHDILDETYVIFTSDNGFHLGQFRLPGGKWQAYEDDIRLPMMIRGPGIQPATTSTMLATHVDLMPTLLGLAGQMNIPATMDGRNLASCLVVGGGGEEEVGEDCNSSTTSSVLVEYLSLGNVTRYNHTMDYYNHSFIALRTIIQQPQSMNDSSITNDHWSYNMFDNGGGPSMTLRDVKYIEYRDSRVDWTAVQPMLEQELFDLERDPYELHNLIPHVSPGEYMIQGTKQSYLLTDLV
jgi:N-acetylglucosamine-6-sulfatase